VEIDESKIEANARIVLGEEMKNLEKGRVKEVVPKDDDEAAMRWSLRRGFGRWSMEQRGMIKLFNAIKAVQTKGEEGSRAVESEGQWRARGCGGWEEGGERYDISPIRVLGSGPMAEGMLY